MSSQIPGYQIIRKIGDGGMSTVYLAIQLSVGREVALKVLSPELRSDPHFAERFYREANIVGRLKHDNVISIFDVARHGKNYCMAMDYLPGGSCKQLLKQTVPILTTLRIIHDISSALEYCHTMGYLHCDIKPDNIMFRADGTAVLTDFGIARDLQEETRSSTVAGTPHYMSPEQAQGHQLDKSTDIYSLGILFYELLTGSLPYTGQDAIVVALQHVSAPIPVLPDDVRIFQPLLTRMLAKRPRARLQNCTELKHAIDFFEAQYLRKTNKSLPLKLQLEFFAHKSWGALKHLLGGLKKLRFSLKHGLYLRLSTNAIDIANIEQILHTMESTTHNSTAITEEIYGDPIALAIATQQAKRLLPTWFIVGFLLVVVVSVSFISSSGILTDYLNGLGSPQIIYVD